MCGRLLRPRAHCPRGWLRPCMHACRHGARTPLTERAAYWEGQEWHVCGQAYEVSGAV